MSNGKGKLAEIEIIEEVEIQRVIEQKVTGWVVLTRVATCAAFTIAVLAGYVVSVIYPAPPLSEFPPLPANSTSNSTFPF